jgi:hypothetical protein
MVFSPRQLDRLVQWVATAPELAEERQAAQRQFFGEDDPRPVQYWAGAEEAVSRRRRFLGYFLFSHHLPDGRTPAEEGASQLFAGQEREEALRAVRGARYVLAVVRSVLPGEAVFLALERERFEVRHKEWSWRLSPQATIYAHLIPVRRGLWLPGPGWLEMPISLGPGLRSHLQDLQPDPISVERMLQNRGDPEDQERERPPRDETLEAAVARMTEAAREAGKDRLIMTPPAWEALIVRYMTESDMFAFPREIIDRVGEVGAVEELNGWMALAHNIWNNTPQPDRGGKTANELSRERPGW